MHAAAVEGDIEPLMSWFATPQFALVLLWSVLARNRHGMDPDVSRSPARPRCRGLWACSCLAWRETAGSA